MKRNRLVWFIMLLVLTVSCSKTWNYENQDKWSKSFPQCKGKHQSPVDLTQARKDYGLKPLFVDYSSEDTVEISLKGKFIKVRGVKGYVIAPDTANYYGHQYYVSELWIHTPSEHTVNGKHYDAELQFVNVDTAGKFLIIGILVKKGAENPVLAQITDNLPEKGEAKILTQPVKFQALLPNSLFYWHYTGSFTVPPCTEGVQWYVFKEPIEASAQQLERLKQAMGETNRKIQPLNDRSILQF